MQKLFNDFINLETFDPFLCSRLFKDLESLNDVQKSAFVISLNHLIKDDESLLQLIYVIFDLSNLPISTENNQLVDLCGTGGSGHDRINTSTLVAFVLSSLGIKIAKHGNRAASGRFGSFDLIEALGIPVFQSKELINYSIDKFNLGLLYAPSFFPILGHLSGVRKSLQITSIFNILGPLLNPLFPKYQFIGTPFRKYDRIVYNVAKKMGRKKILVYGSDDGLDDISLNCESIYYDDTYKSISALSFNQAKAPVNTFNAKTVEEKILIAIDIINGTCTSKHLNHVIINSAFIYANLKGRSYPETYIFIEDHIKSKKVKNHLDTYKEFVHDTITTYN